MCWNTFHWLMMLKNKLHHFFNDWDTILPTSLINSYCFHLCMIPFMMQCHTELPLWCYIAFNFEIKLQNVKNWSRIIFFYYFLLFHVSMHHNSTYRLYYDAYWFGRVYCATCRKGAQFSFFQGNVLVLRIAYCNVSAVNFLCVCF